MNASQADVPGFSSDEVVGPVQFEDVYVHEIRTSRTAIPAGENREPIFEPSITHHQVSDDGKRLLVLLRGVVTYQFRETATATVDCTVIGHFVADPPISAGDAQAFAYTNGMILLWPYLRAEIGAAARAMQVPFPPIPILSAAEVLRLMNERTVALAPKAVRQRRKAARKAGST